MSDALIKNLNKYVTLTADEIKIVEFFFQPRKFRKRQYILQEGDVSRLETFITKGLTRIYEVDDKGQEHVLQFGLEDWWVGDLYSFLAEVPTTYNIDCLEDTEVLQITKPNLESLYERVPKIERHFRIMVQNAFIASNRRLSATLAKSAQERYEEFIKKYPQIEQRVPNHQIASYLGITPQSLSRIRSQAVAQKKI
jgi:CRP-like cAMP-binding protein